MNVKDEVQNLKALCEGMRERIGTLEKELKKSELPFQDELDELIHRSTYQIVKHADLKKVEVRRYDEDTIIIHRGLATEFKPGTSSGKLLCSDTTLKVILKLKQVMEGDC